MRHFKDDSALDKTKQGPLTARLAWRTAEKEGAELDEGHRKKGLRVKVFYLRASGSSWLTSPAYSGLCDLNVALKKPSFHHDTNQRADGPQSQLPYV